MQSRGQLRVSWLFLTVVALVLVGAFTLSPSISLLIEQNARINELQGDLDEVNADIDELEQEVANWSDPAYVQAQARDRLYYVMPGEQAFTVLDDREGLETLDDTSVTSDSLTQESVDWATVGLESIIIAGVTEQTQEELADTSVIVEGE
ncbi:Cell division protein DivIC (FtsB), stabilizes FtsL against RasP cleavage [Agrococcus casei LMG 22410]|uniref:Cell division protein DivIC (FtsB), stabilizes FtsL against RasP cleavage n=1 Tax=Agrococcus casei LMG 22410 TaxID=1255656 RepID=A0A1R4GCV9_9MICO|nr:Cell division protein DivIC (FtsB), stabilizes FtsL against RasP cleavage [Agrococcus casei LMG 22410]